MPQGNERKFRMIIADDEPATRHGIRTAVNWELVNVEIVGEARDGLEAMSLAQQLLPDIIICDIRMPRMDGIDLASALAARHIDAQIVFISGYSNREYLKSALQLGAIDFIDKPFQLSELISAVDRAKSKCAKSARAHPDDSGLALALISGEGISGRAAPLEDGRGMFSFIVRLEPIEGQDAAVYSLAMSRQTLSALEDRLGRLFNGRCVASPVANGIIGHANLPKGGEDELPGLMNELLEAGAGQILCIGMGDPVYALTDLHQSYQQAYAASASAFLMGHARVIPFHMLSQKPYSQAASKSQDFIKYMQQDSVTEAMETLEAMVGYMRTCRYQDIPLIKDELSRIALWLSAQMKTPGATGVAEKIGAAQDLDVVKGLMIDQMDALLDMRNRLTSKGRVAFDAERYILSHLDSDLSVQEIAGQVYVTPTHLCYLYKKNTGHTIGQFILRVRMQKAEAMMRNTAMKVGEIARAVGYANPNYFSKSFQEYFGLTPTEYREQHL